MGGRAVPSHVGPDGKSEFNGQTLLFNRPLPVVKLLFVPHTNFVERTG